MKKTALLSIILAVGMLVSACGPQAAPPVESSEPPVETPPTEAVTPTGPETGEQTGSGVKAARQPHTTFINDAGQELYIGMSREDCASVLGLELNDGWYTHIPMPAEETPEGTLDIVSADGVIRTISSGTALWSMGSGAAIGTARDAAFEGFGEPDTEEVFEGHGTYVSFILEDGHTVYFTVGPEDTLIGCGATAPQGSGNTLGIRELLGRGTGDGHVGPFFRSPREFIDISHRGAGAFKVTLTTAQWDSVVAVDRVGTYDGRIFSPSHQVTGIDVVADGDWQIWADYHAAASIFTDAHRFEGTGDYATLYLDPDAGGVAGTWRVTHEGSGKFILRKNSLFTDLSGDEALLLEVEGPYSGEIQVENTVDPSSTAREDGIAPVAFEIITEGRWTLERLG